MPVFPSELEQNFFVEGFEDSFKDPVIRSTVDAGPEKTRLRYSAVPEYIRGRLWLKNLDDYNTFISFWKNDLKYGVLPFEWKHPVTGETVNMRFRNIFRISTIAENQFVVEMDLEVLP